MAKTYTPEEVARAVLAKCQEIAKQHSLTKKEKHLDEKEDKELCEDIAEKEVDEHEKELHEGKKDVEDHEKEMHKKKEGSKLKKFLLKKKNLKKTLNAPPMASASAGQPSIAEQINWGGKYKKSEVESVDLQKKGVHAEVSSVVDQGVSIRGGNAKAHKKAKALGLHNQAKEFKDSAKWASKDNIEANKKIKPDLPKSEVEKCGTVEKCGEQKVIKKTKKAEANKAIGLSAPKDPMGVTEKVKEPAVSDMPAKPKAATTLKSDKLKAFLDKKKK